MASGAPSAADDALDLAATKLAPAMRSARTTPREHVERILDRYDADCKYDAIFTQGSFKPAEVAAAFGVPVKGRPGAGGPLSPAKKAAGPAPRGALAGVPFVVSANIDAAPYPTSAGSASLALAAPNGDAPVVASLKSAGAVLLGQANVGELGMGVTGANAAHGTVKNVSDSLRHVVNGGDVVWPLSRSQRGADARTHQPSRPPP